MSATAVALPIPPLFDEARLAIAGFLSRYSGPTRVAYTTDQRRSRRRGATSPVVTPQWRHGTVSSVPSIQVKDVPDDVHATLRRRAAAAGMSLQGYLLGRLVEDASTPTVEEVLDRAGGRAGGSATLARTARAVRADRSAR